MTREHEASRTLVKSPPELWAECSDSGSLARHLGEFGVISITRLEPETTVAWEGEHASGTVQIEPSGWGTRVRLTAQAKVAISEPEPEPGSPPIAEEESHATLEEAPEDPDLEPVADGARARARWRRITARVRGVFRGPEASDELEDEAALEVSEPPQDEPPEPELLEPPEPVEPPEPEIDAEAILTAALDSLGQAHHRPFSRA